MKRLQMHNKDGQMMMLSDFKGPILDLTMKQGH